MCLKTGLPSITQQGEHSTTLAESGNALSLSTFEVVQLLDTVYTISDLGKDGTGAQKVQG